MTELYQEIRQYRLLLYCRKAVCGAAVMANAVAMSAAASDLRNFMFIIFFPYSIAGKPLFFLLLQIVITESNIPMTAVFIRYIFPFKIR